MYIKKEIMEKVEEIEKVTKDLNRCLRARICPKCGDRLTHRITDDANLPDEVFECLDISCKFSHTRSWA